MRHWWVRASLLLLAACDPEETKAEDLDADGFAEPTDCDDHDASVHPEAAEICNGADDDCDGMVDDAVPDTFEDVDGDGYGDLERPVACGAGVELPTDCDDADAAVHPGVTDRPHDGIDADCDGDDTRLDCETRSVQVGDLVLEGPDAAAQLDTFCASYDTVTGSVIVRDTPLEVLVLDCLCEVGDLTIESNAALVQVVWEEAPLPATIGGSLIVTDAPLLEVVEGVDSIGGDLVVSDAPKLDLLGLDEVGGDLRWAGGGVLDEVAISHVGVRSVGGSVALGPLPPGLRLYLDLESIGGDLGVRGSSPLPDSVISGGIELEELQTVGGAFVVEDCTDTDVVATALEEVGGDLVLSDSAGLWLDLPEVGTFDVGGDLVIEDLAGTTELALPAGTVGGDLEVRENPDLVEVQLDLSSVGGDFVVEGNPALVSVRNPYDPQGGHVVTLGGSLIVRDSGAGVLDLGPFAGTVPGSVVIAGASLESGSVSHITAIDGDLELTSSGWSPTFASDLTSVGGDLTLYDAHPVSLGNLATVGGDLWVEDSQLEALVLDVLVEVGGVLALSDDDLLLSASFGALSQVNVVHIEGNDRLASMPDLPSLVSAGQIEVTGNDTLTSLTGLDALQTVTGRLSISYNPVLADLDAPLGTLQSVGALSLLYNPALSAEEIAAFIEAIPSLGPVTDIGNGS
jgi:hypothetical protein